MNRTRFTSALLVTIVLLCGWAGGVAGQSEVVGVDGLPDDGVVASLGFGVGSAGAGGQLSLWAHLGKHAVGVRTAATFRFELLGPSDSDEDYAFLYGRRSGPGKLWGRVGIGPAFVRTVRHGEAIDCAFFLCTYETDRSSTVGLALQADGVLKLFGPVGLGATVYGNLNGESSFGGATLGVAIGSVGS